MHSINQQDQSQAPNLAPHIRESIATLAASLQRNVPSLTDSEKQILWDLQRPHRYQWLVLGALISMIGRSRNPADKAALPEAIWTEILAHEQELAGLAIVAIEGDEVRTRGAIDLAEHERDLRDDRSAREKLALLARTEIGVCRHLLIALATEAR